MQQLAAVAAAALESSWGELLAQTLQAAGSEAASAAGLPAVSAAAA